MARVNEEFRPQEGEKRGAKKTRELPFLPILAPFCG